MKREGLVVDAQTLWDQVERLARMMKGAYDRTRGVVVGRKNHYGSRSRRGTEVAALLYTLVESAKLAGVDPKSYLRAAVLAANRGEQAPLPHELAR